MKPVTQVLPEAAAVWAALAAVKDPEIPAVSVVEMGMVHRVEVAGDQVRVQVTPTFVGCPALALISRRIREQVAAVPGVAAVAVEVVFDPPWSSDRITPSGRARLQAYGIAPPVRACGCSGGGGGSPIPAALPGAPPCPFCGSADTQLENIFGPTACRSLYYCNGCRNPFEAMKAV